MYIKEQYIMHQISYHFVHNEGYEILHINQHHDEIWLEKYTNRVSNIIRIIHKGFDWKNDLKADISQTFQKATTMEKVLIGKEVNIHNIYVATYEPIDDWSILKHPIQYKRRKQMNMKVYYFTEENVSEELHRLSQTFGPIKLESTKDQPPYHLEKKVQEYKHHLQNTFLATKKEIESIFSYGKPLLTYILLIANIILFFIVETNGGSTDTENLIRFGAKYNPAIMDGEIWRIVSSMFLHIGLLHLMMNMLALYYLGSAVERIYGSVRFILIYFLAGIGGGVASFALTINVSAGASGAIFGLFGALLFFGIYHKKLFFQTMGKAVIFLIGFNIVFGFLVQGIDNSAHLGGLIAGFIASAIVHLPRMKQRYKQILALVIYCLIIAVLMSYGLQNGKNNAMFHLDKSEQLQKESRYEEMILHADQGLKKRSDKELESQLYFQRSYAYIELEEYDQAIADLEESIKFQPEFNSYFNLALVYSILGETDESKEAIQHAYRLKPTDEKLIQLYEEIMGEAPPNS